MTKLEQVIQKLQQELQRWRGRLLKETPTRTVFIEPLLEALGTDGLDWCVLTNGVRYRVYRSSEKAPAPDKLLFECSIDPKDNPGSSIEDIARLFERLSKGAMAEGQLDAWGKAVFIDAKLRKALEKIFANPPRTFINLLRKESGDSHLRPEDIRQSLQRIGQWTEQRQLPISRIAPSKPSKQSTPTRGPYTLEQHLTGKPQAIQELFHRLDTAILSLAPGQIQKRPLAKVIDYLRQNKIFCSVHLQKSGLRIWVKLNYNVLENPPDFVRDVSKIGHWGVGNTEIALTDENQLSVALELIKHSYEKL